MKVKELIESLSEMDPDLDLWCASDDEGNSYNEMHFGPVVRYVPKGSEWRTDEAWTEEDLIEEHGKDALKEYTRVCLL
jgi:hypothetical protein